MVRVMVVLLCRAHEWSSARLESNLYVLTKHAASENAASNGREAKGPSRLERSVWRAGLRGHAATEDVGEHPAGRGRVEAGRLEVSSRRFHQRTNRQRQNTTQQRCENAAT